MVVCVHMWNCFAGESIIPLKPQTCLNKCPSFHRSCLCLTIEYACYEKRHSTICIYVVVIGVYTFLSLFIFMRLICGICFPCFFVAFHQADVANRCHQRGLFAYFVRFCAIQSSVYYIIFLGLVLKAENCSLLRVLFKNLFQGKNNHGQNVIRAWRLAYENACAPLCQSIKMFAGMLTHFPLVRTHNVTQPLFKMQIYVFGQNAFVNQVIKTWTHKHTHKHDVCALFPVCSNLCSVQFREA